MASHDGLKWTAWVLLGAGVLFYVTSVAGLFWPKPTPPTDLGLYAVTVVLLGLGVGAWMLRAAKLHSAAAE